MQHTICLVAGKSGGHIIPCLTIAEQYTKKNPATNIIFFSTNAPLDMQLLNNHPCITNHIPLPCKTLRTVTTPLHLARAFFTSIYQLHKHKPTKIISSGGLVALPVCIAAILLRIPIELHELNVEPGRAVKFLSRLAQSIFVCFEQTGAMLPKDKCQLRSYPVRFTQEEKKITQVQAQKKLNLSPSGTTLFILGGSQGSLFINKKIKQLLEDNHCLHSKIQIIHQTGSCDPSDLKKFYCQHNIPAYVFTYTDCLADCYAAADIIICRAGAGTLFEALFFGKQCITIPLETKNSSHQLDNARAMAAEYPKQFTVIRQQELEVLFANKIKKFVV